MATPHDSHTPNSSIVLYQTEDGRTRIQCRFEDESIWLTQALIAELFQTTVPNINLHLKAIYEEKELAKPATIKSYLIVRQEEEDRWVTFGLSSAGQIVVVCHTFRETGDAEALIRLISSRKATRKEEQQYGK